MASVIPSVKMAYKNLLCFSNDLLCSLCKKLLKAKMLQRGRHVSHPYIVSIVMEIPLYLLDTRIHLLLMQKTALQKYDPSSCALGVMCAR